MTQRVESEPFYILHTRPYSNTSLLVDALTQNHGRISLLARSARGPKSRYRGMLQVFSPLMGNWTGTRELKNLGNVERMGAMRWIEGQALVCGFYLNELLQRLLQKEDAHPEIFYLYEASLQQLEKATDFRVTLRCFEKRLLDALGYGLPLQVDVQTRASIDPEAHYQFMPDRGFLRCIQDLSNPFIFSGKVLLGLLHETFDEEILPSAKRLLRIAVNVHLGDRPIKSRELL